MTKPHLSYGYFLFRECPLENTMQTLYGSKDELSDEAKAGLGWVGLVYDRLG